MLYDTGALISCMAKRFFNTLPINPKLLPCNRYITGAGGEVLRLVGKCFVQLQFGKKVFRDRVVVIKYLWHKYILGQVLHKLYQFGTGYSTTGRHFVNLMGNY